MAVKSSKEKLNRRTPRDESGARSIVKTPRRHFDFPFVVSAPLEAFGKVLEAAVLSTERQLPIG